MHILADAQLSSLSTPYFNLVHEDHEAAGLVSSFEGTKKRATLGESLTPS
jgi:hypothetical protein